MLEFNTFNCPFCGSEAIDFTEDGKEENFLLEFWCCADCGKTFSAKYELKLIEVKEV